MDVRVGPQESRTAKNWSFWTVVLEKTLESPLDCKEIQPVHPQGYQFWVFVGRTDVEAETPILCPPDVKSWLIWKDPNAGKDWGEEKDDRGWDGWMASLTQWTWVWVDSGSWWWTGRPDVLQFMGSQRVGHDWATELNWNDVLYLYPNHLLSFLPFFRVVFIWCILTCFPGFSLEAAFHVNMFPVPQSWLTVPPLG